MGRIWAIEFRDLVRHTVGMRRLFACLSALALLAVARAGDFTVASDLPYPADGGHGEYARKRCKLDLYLPKGSKGFATMVWFHGGSIKSGEKDGKIALAVSERFAGDGVAVASVNYRLSPKVKFPTYIEDCAASVAWVVKNIARYGGDPKKVFVSGHSAGGYLCAMVGMDSKYLGEHGLSPNDLAGFMPVAGQMITHSTVREERGIHRYRPVIDESAPSFFARKDAPPFLCLVGDQDLPARVEENLLFVAFMRANRNTTIEYYFGRDRNHGTIASKLAESGDPGAARMLAFINKHSK